jgi:nitronate monooxygenase
LPFNRLWREDETVACWSAGRQRLDAYFAELGLDKDTVIPSANRAPFDGRMCELVEEFHPEVVSFHFGLPDKNLLARVRTTGARIISSATSVDEARWLEDHGCDAIVSPLKP